MAFVDNLLFEPFLRVMRGEPRMSDWPFYLLAAGLVLLGWARARRKADMKKARRKSAVDEALAQATLAKAALAQEAQARAATAQRESDALRPRCVHCGEPFCKAEASRETGLTVREATHCPRCRKEKLAP